MANIKLVLLYGGDDIQKYYNTVKEYNEYLFLSVRYNFKLIEQIPIAQQKVITIDVKGLEAIDWTKYDLEPTVLQIIKDLERCSTIARELRNIKGKIESSRFEERYELSRHAEEAIRILELFQGSKLLSNVDLRIRELKHTLHQEVGSLLRYRDKDASYKMARALRDAQKYFVSDLDIIIHYFQNVKLVEQV